MHPRRWLSIVVVLCATFPVSAQRGGSDDPDPVIRSLMQAMYANDVAAYNTVTIPHPLRPRLTSGGRVNENALRELKEDPGGLQIKQQRPFEFQGKEAKPGGKWTVCRRHDRALRGGASRRTDGDGSGPTG